MQRSGEVIKCFEGTKQMDTTPHAADHAKPIPNRPIQWAVTDDLESELELRKNRNWLDEELITLSQKHWNCSRQQAAARLLTALDESSA